MVNAYLDDMVELASDFALYGFNEGNKWASMAVGRKSVCSGEVVEVESDRPIRSSVIVTAYLSRKRAATPNWTPKSVEREKQR